MIRFVCVTQSKNGSRLVQKMQELFSDLPHALENTKEIADKVEVYGLNNDPIMPEFVIPDQFNNADDYLRHITYLGAEKRYSDVNDDIRSRIDFELETIKIGIPRLFLIVWDFWLLLEKWE